MNAQVNPYVASPEWHGLIVWYFFLGGIAAGSYVMAVMADLFGDADDRRGVRIAYYLAFPLVNVCGLLLVLDLGRPERFWHMLVQSNTGWPMLKWWSPLSAGSWGLALFGFFSMMSFGGALAEDGWLGLERFAPLAARLRTGPIGRLFALGGILSAFFLGSYTGVLLAASNQPIWSNTTWVGALFLASATSTGVAAIILLDFALRLDVGRSTIERLERLDAWAICFELGMLAALALSLGKLMVAASRQWPGILVPSFVVPLGLVVPLALKRFRAAWATVASCVLVLSGSFALRTAIVAMPATFVGSHR